MIGAIWTRATSWIPKWARRKKKPLTVSEMTDQTAGLLARRVSLQVDLTRLNEEDERLGAILREQSIRKAGQQVRQATAAKIASVRQDSRRAAQVIGALTHQINILQTDMHNRSIVTSSRGAGVPSAEAVQDHAIRAEEMMEQLSSDAEMANVCSPAVDEIPEEHLDIMAEFDKPVEEPEPEPEAAVTDGLLPPANEWQSTTQQRPRREENKEPIAESPPF